ncbi:translation elongation factor Ts [Pseudanabaena yagii]|uniref:translation elongation factor Ts n=1 Tax=Pseudanabaena yagii TaxID=2661615 RepID=UPI001B7D1320|nr:translation elongation factor Ts [Pseudanabaena yagii]
MADITTKQIQELRARTGAGIKDCKAALVDSEGDFTKATEYLRQKGLASAVKKASRAATEGIVHSYIHFGSRIGVLVEVNCETDFVARREELKELADSVAKQIAASPNVEYVSVSDIPASFVEKEKQIEAGKDDLASKPAAIRDKIVLGRIEKRLKELCLLDQPYIKDQSITVDELVKQTGAKLSENVKVRRFVRFVVGEEVESDNAAEAPAEAPAPAPVEAAAPAEAPKEEKKDKKDDKKKKK